MDRAGRVLEHPLAGITPRLAVRVEHDPETGANIPYELVGSTTSRDSWEYLATLLRPIIFLENDSISVGRFTGLLEREHPPLRGSLKPFRKSFREWRDNVNFSMERTMVLGAPPLPETTPGGREQQFSGFKMGKPYRLSRSDLLDGRQSDWDLALKFLNTWLWHADTKTAAEFGNDPPEVLLMMSHAAEIRAISSVRLVRWLADYVEGCRSVGYDF